MSLDKQHIPSIPISIREWIVCFTSAFTLVATAWSLGGYKNWALSLLLIGSMSCFLASILPMTHSWNGSDGRHGNLKNLKRLLAHPIFFGFVCLILYVVIQYLNPTAIQVFNEKSWWVESIEPSLGLNWPSSVKSDYYPINGLRVIAIHGSAMCLACGILVGIQRRKTALIIIWAFIISGVGMGFIAMLQKLSGSDKILWIFGVTNPNPWGTFAYRNQGAAYLILIATIVGFLYFFYLSKSRSKYSRGGPHFLCAFFIFILFSSIWLSLSRSGIILGGFLVFSFCVLTLYESYRHLVVRNFLISISVIVFIVIAGIFSIGNLSDWDAVDHRYNKLKGTLSEIETYDRTLSTLATWDMATDRLKFGWGAGSFRYIFPIYQSKYEQIWYLKKHKKRGWEGRKIYNYAHNDWVQFLAEYGIVGSSLIFLLLLLLFWYTFSLSNLNVLAFIYIYSGIGIIFFYNFIDFIFSSPSFWVAYWGSMILVGKFGELLSKRKVL